MGGSASRQVGKLSLDFADAARPSFAGTNHFWEHSNVLECCGGVSLQVGFAFVASSLRRSGAVRDLGSIVVPPAYY